MRFFKRISFVFVFFLAPIFAQGDWKLQNPLPTNHDLSKVKFINASTGWIAGHGGMILKTLDGGVTWAIRPSGTTEDLYGIDFIDANNGWAVGDNGTILKTTDGGFTWTKNLQSMGVNYDFTCVRAINSNTVWAFGLLSDSGTFLLKTTDGGKTWINPLGSDIWGKPVFISGGPGTLFFVDANTGWAVTNDEFHYRIYRTTDGGKTWPLFTMRNGSMVSIYFANANTGWSVIDGKIRNTTDGGINWLYQWGPTEDSLRDVRFIDANTGWAIGVFGSIIKTIDGGANWSELRPKHNFDALGDEYISVFFLDNNNGWIVGRYGLILKTLDGGVTWTAYANCFEIFKSVFFLNHNEGWAVGTVNNTHNALVFKTTDGGATWSKKYFPPIWCAPQDIVFVNATSGWITSYEGLYRTTDGGLTWESQLDNTGYGISSVKIFFLDANTGWVSCGNSHPWGYKTIDGGQTWTGIYGILESIFFVDANTGWTVGDYGEISKTVDGGQTWIPENSHTSKYLNGVFFLNANTGWVAGQEGTLLRTTDGGATWKGPQLSGQPDFYSVCFVDANHGYAGVYEAGSYGARACIFESHDGGQTWAATCPKNFDRDTNQKTSFYGLHFVDANTGWAAGGSVILKYDGTATPTITVANPNGGEVWQAGSAQAITWTNTDVIANVKIEISTNAGANWTTLVASTPNLDSYTWTVPSTVSTNCLARVSDASNSAINDVCDAAFTIVLPPGIAVASPNGGESWLVGSSHNITWTSTGTVGNVKIEYSTNSGTGWTVVITSTANTGSCAWTVPNALSTTCLVRVSEALTGTPADVSDAVFAIVIPSWVSVTSPNGGESWLVGSSHNITWTTTGTVGNLKIEYSTDNGTSYSSIVASTANTGSYGWTVPNAPSTTCLVRVSDALIGTLTDMSDAIFSIVFAAPRIALSRTSLAFGAVAGGTSTSSQSVVISNSGGGTLALEGVTWNKSWLKVVVSGLGTGTGILKVSVNASGLVAGTYVGTITVMGTNASNSPQTLSVTLTVVSGSGQAPFGSFATPADGATGISGAIPVTGWVLDDIETTKVEIWRDPVAGEGAGIIFIGSAIFVEGARPDIETGYPGYPFNYRAGWGYMLLTNFLPGQGNGIFKIHAFATDKEGNSVLLGTKTMTCDNSHATKPFGTIDTPAQGGTVSGNLFVNFGWVLTPLTKTVPKDGSTIDVYVDSVKVGNLATAPNVYNQYRVDVAAAFPGLNNSAGPVGAYYLDTTKLTNGVHTIYWIATDDAGASDGIGSRYFNVINTSTTAGENVEEASTICSPEQTRNPSSSRFPEKFMDMDSFHIPEFSHVRKETIPKIEEILDLPMTFEPLRVRTGFDLKAEPSALAPDNYGAYHIEIPEVNRMEVDLGSPSARLLAESGPARYQGFFVVGDELRPLPIGSTFDALTGRFSWMPGPGFLGSYELVFLKTDGFGNTKKIPLKVKIRPKF